MAVDPAEVLDRVEARKLDRSQQAALVAAREAWAEAGAPAVDPERLGAVISTGIGGLTSLMNSYDILLERGPSRISPHMVTQIMPNGPAAVVGLEVGARAGVHGQVSACASGAEAVSYGRADDPDRSRRRRHLRRHRGVHPPDHDGRLRRDARPVDPQRRPDRRLAALRHRPRRLRHGRGRGRHGPRVRRVRRRPRRDGATACTAARASRPTATTSRSPTPRASGPPGRSPSPSRMPGSASPTSSTSTRTPPRPRRATSRSRSRSTAPSAAPPTTSSSRAPSR